MSRTSATRFGFFSSGPGFAAVAILTLALGIGATTAIFTVVNAVLLSPLPFRDADRLAKSASSARTAKASRFPTPTSWRGASQNQTADAIAVYDISPATLTGDGAPERIGAAGVTDRFFDVLGARPLLGRVFQDGDDKPGAAEARRPQPRVLDRAASTATRRRRAHGAAWRRQPHRSSA